MSHNIVEVDTEVVVCIKFSKSLFTILCIIHSCAHKMSDYIRIFLPLEKNIEFICKSEGNNLK